MFITSNCLTQDRSECVCEVNVKYANCLRENMRENPDCRHMFLMHPEKSQYQTKGTVVVTEIDKRTASSQSLYFLKLFLLRSIQAEFKVRPKR